MAEILGLGVTHWPTLLQPDEALTGIFRYSLTAPNVPPTFKDPANWPAGMIAELGDDEGLAAARRCGERFANDFRAIRKILDDFAPDLVLVWGDDQYENFREDIVPAFCLHGYDPEFEVRPWQHGHDPSRSGVGGKRNRWGEPADWVLRLRGHRDAAKALATGLIERGIDMAYSYKPLHDPLAHAFTNTFLYLDWDRAGFPYPVIPFSINCYGSTLLHAKGGLAALFKPLREAGELPDPPAPPPWRCMQMGAAVAEILAASRYRVALIASSSWSHSFLCEKNGWLWPDHEGDRLLFDALSRGDYETWRRRPLAEMERSGQHEMLNWMALVGAMEALGRKPVIHDYMETFILASNKCFLSFPA
ncbi:MAG: extradiol ring-cleavage dioxygenase [Alphaproteobacteria bacterium]|nr:extradiol ring-cleavage dioxygenase [Alphaproteobacteria bacterium]